jgi:hypothetical protein
MISAIHEDRRADDSGEHGGGGKMCTSDPEPLVVDPPAPPGYRGSKHDAPAEGHNCLISTVIQMHTGRPYSEMTPDEKERHRDWCKTVKSNLMDVPECDLQQTSMLNQDHVPHILDTIGYVGPYKVTWFYFTEGRYLEEVCPVQRAMANCACLQLTIAHRHVHFFPLVRDDTLPTPAPVTTSRPAPVPLRSGRKRVACLGPAATPGGTSTPTLTANQKAARLQTQYFHRMRRRQADAAVSDRCSDFSLSDGDGNKSDDPCNNPKKRPRQATPTSGNAFDCEDTTERSNGTAGIAGKVIPTFTSCVLLFTFVHTFPPLHGITALRLAGVLF